MMRSRSGRESHRRDGARSKCGRSLCIPCTSLMETLPATLSAQVALCMADLEQGLIEKIYREESGRILATLIRLLGDFDLAEESAQEAFAAALEQWPRQSIPGNPRAWLVSTARNKAVDLLRRRSRFENK